jgi:hypothetical protein
MNIRKYVDDFINEYSIKYDLRLGEPFNKEKANCAWFTDTFFKWAKEKDLPVKIVYFDSDKEAHIAPIINDTVIDFTIKQFTKDANEDYKLSSPDYYKKYGYDNFEILNEIPNWATIRSADKKIPEYGIFYLKTVFPKRHKLEWLNYLSLSRSLPKDLSEEIDNIANDINSREGIVIPLDRAIQPGCVTLPEIVEEVANEVYNRFCEIFEKLTGDKDCIRLVWGIGEIENVDEETTHHLHHYPILIKVGRFLDSSKKPGIYKV